MQTAIVTVAASDLDRLIEDAVRRVVREEIARIQAPDADQLLDVNAAAALIGKTPNALRVATSRGDFKSVKQGRSVRWRKADLLDQWVEQS